MADRPEHVLIDADHLQRTLKNFAAERNWERFHSPKNLCMALAGEVGELMELFQWLTEEESRQVMNNPDSAINVRHEVADVLLYLMQIVNVLGINLDEAVKEKLAINTVKYPRSV